MQQSLLNYVLSSLNHNGQLSAWFEGERDREREREHKGEIELEEQIFIKIEIEFAFVFFKRPMKLLHEECK